MRQTLFKEHLQHFAGAFGRCGRADCATDHVLYKSLKKRQCKKLMHCSKCKWISDSGADDLSHLVEKHVDYSMRKGCPLCVKQEFKQSANVLQHSCYRIDPTTRLK